MSNSSLGQAERTAVREKLFGKAGGVSEKYINSADELACLLYTSPSPRDRG